MMKYFTAGRTENGYGLAGIILDEKVFSIAKVDGKIVFREECDGFFQEEFEPKEAVELLKEAIDWIESETQNKKRDLEKIKIWVCDFCGGVFQFVESKWKIGDTPAIEVIFNNVDDIPLGRIYEVICKKCIEKQNGVLKEK
jgi:hypothetical protein